MSNKPKKPVSTAINGVRRPGRKPYPIIPFEQAMRLGVGIRDFGAGHPMKRTTLLEKLELLHNQSTKDLITASSKYGITQGAHDAEEIKLTDEGQKALSASSRASTDALVKLAITEHPPFEKLYSKYKGGKMPSLEVMRDELDDLDAGDRAPCVDVFVQNAKFAGVLQTSEGAEYIVDASEANSPQSRDRLLDIKPTLTSSNQPLSGEDFESVCFFIAPIGADGSEFRRHSDAILSSYVEKALSDVSPKLRVVRADKITQPGMITKQVLEYLTKSRLVVADLSFHNPNVFYELAVRHATGKPVVHIKRTSDSLPFDNKDFRTIDIQFDDKFDILAQLESKRSEIALFSRQALSTEDNIDNPLLTYLPDHRFTKLTKM